MLPLLGCNGDEGGGPEDAAAAEHELLARVSAALRTRPARYPAFDRVAYADLAGAREQLGLPEDADLSARGQRHLLLSFATRPLLRFATFARPRSSLGGLGEVLDGGRIEAAAGTNFAFAAPLSDAISPDAATVIRTGEPFEQIAEALAGLGYEERDDGLLLGPEPLEPEEHRHGSDPSRPIAFPAVGAAAGGIVVFAGSPRAALAALEGAGSELTPAARLVSELPGVSRTAGGSGLLGRCVRALGLGEDAVPREGVLVVVVDGEAEGRRHWFAGRTQPTTFFGRAGGPTTSEGEIEFGEGTAAGDRAEARFSSPDDLNATRLPIEEVQQPYNCPEQTD